MQNLFDQENDESPPTSEMSALHRKKKRGKKKRKQDESPRDSFDIPGVTKIIISPLAQKVIECSVGQDVTSESPWKFVPKEAFEGNLQLQKASSEFLPIKEELLSYPKQEVLLGYIPDETKEYDEFYICLTEPAAEAVSEIIDKRRKEQEIRVQNAIVKTARPWKSLGSEAEVDLQIYKHNRPLLSVEIETTYPIMTTKCEFRIKPVEQIRDGYVEFDTSRREPNDVERRRIDACTQVTPYFDSHHAQTIYTFPKNAWTQYECSIEVMETVSEETDQNVQNFLVQEMDYVRDLMDVNNGINFYENEYRNMVYDEQYTRVPQTSDFEEFISFADVNFCKGKKIVSLTWHPMWTGTLAIAYAPEAPNEYLKCKSAIDEVSKAIYDLTPVLLWSFKDDLNARLHLETPREISCLSFCPYNENLLIGGCVNGQILLWDIENKLESLEEEENLSQPRPKYHDFVYELMKWSETCKDLKVLRPTAVSEKEYGHSSRVSDIKWLSPYQDISKDGKMSDIPDEEARTSLVFMTCSYDGVILIWDMLIKRSPHVDVYRIPRILRRLKKRPRALQIRESPFGGLDKVLRPRYRIQVQSPQLSGAFQLSGLSIKTAAIEYVKKLGELEQFSGDRITYEPIFNNPKIATETEFAASTIEGDFVWGSWEGIEIDPYEAEQVLYSENCKIRTLSKYHDGPIVSLSRCTAFPDIILTVGGKIFALWKSNLVNKPVMRRRCKQKYTHGAWDNDVPHVFRLTRDDGFMETWNLKIRSDTFVELKSLSGVSLGGTFRHPLSMPKNIMGVADARGWFRTFRAPEIVQENAETADEYSISKMCQREVDRKTAFIRWQEKWNARNEQLMKSKKEREAVDRKSKETKTKSAKTFSTKTEPATSKSERATVSSKRLRGKRAEWAQERWMLNQGEHMKATLLKQKGLNRELLEIQQLPLTRIQEERRTKKARQERRLQDAEKIFSDAVATLFPAAVEEKPPPTPDPYTETYSIEATAAHYRDYLELEKSCEGFIKDNPYAYPFNWLRIMSAGKDRRKMLDGYYERGSHRDRIVREKKKKQEEERARLLAAALAQETAKKTRAFRHVQRKVRPEEPAAETQKESVPEEKKPVE